MDHRFFKCNTEGCCTVSWSLIIKGPRSLSDSLFPIDRRWKSFLTVTDLSFTIQYHPFTSRLSIQQVAGSENQR